MTCSPRGVSPPSGVHSIFFDRSFTKNPGAMAFTRIFAGARYCARNCVQFAIAALLIAYAATRVNGR